MGNINTSVSDQGNNGLVQLPGLEEWEEKAICEIAEAVGTPVYVYFADRIKRFVESLPEQICVTSGNSQLQLKYCYAMLANSNPYLVQEIVQTIASFKRIPGVLAASVTDLRLLRSIYQLPENLVLVYADSVLPEDGLLECKRLLQQGLVSGVYLILQNEGQCNRFAEWCKHHSGNKSFHFAEWCKNHSGNKSFHVGLRVKLESGQQQAYTAYSGKYSRFGTSKNQLEACISALDQACVTVSGFHIYPGTNLLNLQELKQTYEEFGEAVKSVSSKVSPTFLDFGGGLGIDYKNRQVVSVEQVISLISETVGKLPKPPEEILLEPGRLIIGPSAVLVSRVVDVVGNDPKFVYLDTGYSHFARPYIYRHLDESSWHHRVKVLVNHASTSGNAPNTNKVFFVGATMASGDFLAGNPSKQEGIEVQGNFERGDLVCFMDVGAYGYCMSSNFSGLLRPPEILVEKKDQNSYRWCVIRQRETFETFIGEVPPCLSWH